MGNYANPNDILLEIVDINDLYLNLNAFEKDISNLNKGQKIKFCLANENQFNRSATLKLWENQLQLIKSFLSIVL